MNIDELTLKQIRELQGLFAPQAQLNLHRHPLLGKNTIIRTITMIFTGRMVEIDKETITLIDCSWIPETERYMKFIAEGAVKECEPYPSDLPVYISRGTILDMCELMKELPRSQK